MHAQTTDCGRGVLVTERDGVAVARIAARRGQAASVAQRVSASHGIELPLGPRRASRGGIGIAGIAPQTWLATGEGAGGDFAQSWQSLLGDCGSVTDQSDAYVMLRLTGPKVRETLARLVPVDVDARSFRVGDLAQTVCGYMRVMLWRLQDCAQGGPVFEIWVGRSLATSLREAIAHCAAQFGVEQGESSIQPTAGHIV